MTVPETDGTAAWWPRKPTFESGTGMPSSYENESDFDSAADCDTQPVITVTNKQAKNSELILLRIRNIYCCSLRLLRDYAKCISTLSTPHSKTSPRGKCFFLLLNELEGKKNYPQHVICGEVRGIGVD